tara:strand:- start:2040 stop:2705 length:666 start_codon:yes stop_codon:yes gene_type:complete
MPLQINKKILVYLFLFLILGTWNNKYIINIELPKIDKIKIIGLKDNENLELKKKLDYLQTNNLFILDKNKIEQILNSYDLIEKYSIYKNYPSSIKLEIVKTKFLAKVNKDGKIFLLGSNGKFILRNFENLDLPFIFGNFRNQDFFQFYESIKEANLDLKKIKNLFFFPSRRWDIEMNSGVIIKLPSENFKESLNLSMKILEEKNFKIIDVRQKNQVITYEN